MSIIDAFLENLLSLKSAADVAAAVCTTRDCLHGLQSDPDDRAYLLRSVSRVATATRRAGWAAIAADLLDWAIDRQLTDRFVYADAIQCRLTLSDLEAAEQILAIARQAGAISTAAYTSILTTYARMGWASRCRRVFACAEADGLTTSECFAALIRAYSHAGRTRQATVVFDRAQRRECADVACHLAMIFTFGHSGQATRARRLFEAACERWPTERRLYTAMIAVYCRNGMSNAAERVLRAAVRRGQADQVTFEVLLGWYARRRDSGRAGKLVAYGDRVGFAAVSGRPDWRDADATADGPDASPSAAAGD